MSQLSRNYSLPRPLQNRAHQDEAQPPNYNEIHRETELRAIPPAVTHPFQHHQFQPSRGLPPLLPPTPSQTGGRTRDPDRLYVPHQDYFNPVSNWSPKSPSTARLSVTPALFQAQSRPEYAWIAKFKELFVKLVVEWWLTEIISWCFSAMCMAAMIGVISYYDGKTLPQWRLGITLNGFISVFSGFAKAALLLPTAECLGQLKW
jgi:hypothetical protein